MFLLLAVVPGAVGLLLIITAVSGFIVWHSTQEQLMMGSSYILFSFIASNAIQKEWKLVMGWLALGVAALLVLGRPEIGAKFAAAALIGVSVTLLAREFLRRRQQYINEKKS